MIHFSWISGLARIRRVLKAQGRPKAEKLEKLMIRIGIFSVLYSVPAAILLGCYAYEVAFQQEWGRTLTCSGCASQSEQIGLRSALSHRPDFSIFMLKYFMTLVVGITSGFWVWSHKTVNSWRKFYCRLFRRRSSVPAECSGHTIIVGIAPIGLAEEHQLIVRSICRNWPFPEARLFVVYSGFIRTPLLDPPHSATCLELRTSCWICFSF